MFLLKHLFTYFLDVLDTTKSDRAAITLRSPRGESRGRTVYNFAQNPQFWLFNFMYKIVWELNFCFYHE